MKRIFILSIILSLILGLNNLVCFASNNDKGTISVNTSASKEVKPILTIDELQAVNYCYKTFFRVVVLSKMGLSEKIIRKRLLFDRKFVAYFQRLFELKIKKEDKYHDTGEFDQMMW